MATERLRVWVSVSAIAVVALVLVSCDKGNKEKGTSQPNGDATSAVSPRDTGIAQPEPLDPSKTYRFEYKSWALSGDKLSSAKGKELVMEIRAHGYELPTSIENPFGPVREVQIGKNITVSGVPYLFIERSFDFFRIEAEVVSFTDQEKRTFDMKNPKVIARGIAGLWFLSTYAAIQQMFFRGLEDPRFDLSPAETAVMILSEIVADARLAKVDGPSGRLRPAPAEWLLMHTEYGSGLVQFERKKISFRDLLDSFDPEIPLTKANVDAVAEELIWTKSLGIAEGSLESLSNSRRLFQALLLEKLGYQVGDPSAPDMQKRGEALKNLTDTRAIFLSQWDDAYIIAPATPQEK